MTGSRLNKIGHVATRKPIQIEEYEDKVSLKETIRHVDNLIKLILSDESRIHLG